MFDLVMALAVGALLPPVIAIIVDSKWKAPVKSLATLLACIVIGFGVALVVGDLDRQSVIQAIAAVYAAATASYTITDGWGGATGAISKSLLPNGLIPIPSARK